VDQFAQATGQSIADIAQRIGVSQLAEQHRDQLRPATEALGRALRVVFLYERCEFKYREMLQQLIEQTHCLYHRFALLLGIRFTEQLRKKMVRPGTIIGGLVFRSVQTVLDTSVKQ
jgi:hypothetical protein